MFLLRNSKGFREHTDAEKFFKERKDKYNHILGEYSYLFKKLFKVALENAYFYHKEHQDKTFFEYWGYERKFQLYKFDFLRNE